jgi:hypothetical protein
VKAAARITFPTLLAHLALGAGAPREMPRATGVRLEAAAPGDVAPLVRARAEAVARGGGHLLVYVGATWCEPCREFHEAALQGRLDPVFPGLVLYEFDADADHERLAAAGYSSRLVPLFVRPGPDGQSSGESTEGVLRGHNAVDDLTPRLRNLLH